MQKTFETKLKFQKMQVNSVFRFCERNQCQLCNLFIKILYINELHGRKLCVVLEL